ncbi:sensor histidine kinase [Flavobacterium flavigenum]|uniref:sensor histidine kinase n=1 Tax=Flavobacterium flavigenum TaxID=3003258 RepID=UPI002482D421|nr:HAMP domain-containing sensor histidine kinase [Flavobacterium flavigenum]
MKKFLLCSILWFISSYYCIAQQAEIAKLKKVLPHIENKESYIDAINRLALLSHLRYRDSCLIYSEQSLSLARKASYQKGIADALNCQGIFFISVNNYQSAHYFNDALEIYRRLGDKENESQMLMNISILLFTDKHEKEALKYIYKAEDLSRNLDKDSIRSIILSDILTLDPKLTAYQRDSIFRKGLDIAHKYKDYRMIISYENNRGTMLYNQGRRLDGLKILLQSEKMADSVGCEYVKVSALMTIGEMFLDLGRDKEGISYYKKGLKISDQYGYPERSLVFAERLYQYFILKNNTAEALEYAGIVIERKDHLKHATSKSGYNYVSYVKQQSILGQMEREQRFHYYLIIFLSIGLTALSFIAFLLWKRYKDKKRITAVQDELRKALTAQNKQLEDRNKFKAMLIAVLAHDVRQPFANTIMTANLLSEQSDFFSDLEKKELLKELESNAKESIFFMDGILEWVKAKKDGYAFKKEELDIASLIEDANSFFTSVQKSKKIQLHYTIGQTAKLYANKMVLLFTIRNLLHNALKFSAPGTVILVNAINENNITTISIKDHGRGITKENLSNLFHPKMNQDNPFGKGAGVALAMCYEMLAQTNCAIRVESEIGKGTTFFIDCPNK